MWRHPTGGDRGNEAGVLHYPCARGDDDHRPAQLAARGSLTRASIERIEALIHQEVGRNIDGVFAATRSGLWGAASALAAAPHVSLGIMTGFYVPKGTPPAAETDGP